MWGERMPVDMTWYVQNRVLYIHVWGEVTEHDMTNMVEKSRAFVDLGTHPVHILSNQLEIEQATFRMNALKDVLERQSRVRMGWMVNVSTNRIASFAITLMAQFGNSRLRQVRTIEDGLAFLTHIDPSLPDLNTISLPELPVQE